MKMSKYEAGNMKEKPIHAAIYVRAGIAGQLSLEEQQKYFNKKMESIRKGDECYADSDS